ncbi:MAG TPA: hypothetical protein VLJ37_07885, partial [bacterium]|nr:hypothetical protein [bacterium]
TGQEMMMAMLAQKTAEQPSAPAGNYEHEEGSSLGWIIGAGVAGLAVGAGVGALAAGSGDNDKKAEAAPAAAPATDAGHPAQPGGGGSTRSANSAEGAAKPTPQKTAEPSKPAAEFGTVGLTDMLSKPKTDRNGNIAWSESPKAAKPTPSPVAAAKSPATATPAAKVDLSMFRPQITVLPAPAETGAAGTVLPPPRPDEVAAGASLPPPAASTGTDISLLDQ